MTKIKDLEELRELAKEGIEVSIVLEGGAKSTKFVKFSTSGKWLVENHIDGTIQRLTEPQLLDASVSCIGTALKLNRLVIDETN